MNKNKKTNEYTVTFYQSCLNGFKFLKTSFKKNTEGIPQGWIACTVGNFHCFR